ncbi:sensor histidine kinase [Spirillospora sp. CA-142024]|uniref:sensor histidine kinase n=1 Tax=Spirillospora sp. CA-142024 TaxID=3240036 RepID=UPI003D902236
MQPLSQAAVWTLPGELAALHGDSAGPRRRTPRDWVVDAVLFAAAALVWFDVHRNPPADVPFNAADLCIGAIACLALWWRRSLPLLVTLLVAVSPLVSSGAEGAAIVSVFSVAVRRERPVPELVTALHMLAVVPTGSLFPPPGLSGGQNAAWLVAMALGALGWGKAVRVRRGLVAGLHREGMLRLAAARRAEREQIAREMHDVLAHRVSLLSVHAGALLYRTERAEAGEGPPLEAAEVREAAEVVHGNARLALTELAEVLTVLRSDDGAESFGSLPCLKDIPALVAEARGAGQQVTLTMETNAPDSLRPQAQRTAFRTVQEGLTNARKHASGAPVSVHLHGHPGTDLEVTVTNPLPGRVAGPPASGTGLAGLAERAALDGGTLEHAAHQGVFRLTVRIPWPP